MKFAHILVAAALAGGAALATPAAAQPKLVSAQPAAGAPAAKTTRIALAFNEKIAPQGSGMSVVMTGMPGMANHAPMKMAGFKTSVSPDGKTLIATFTRALPAGTYEVKWTAAAASGRAQGQIGFTAK